MQNTIANEPDHHFIETQMNPMHPQIKVEIHTSQDCPLIKNHTAVLYNKLIYVFGGYDGKKNHNTLYTFDIETKEWKMPSVFGNEPPGRNGHTATLVGKIHLLIFHSKITKCS
jgi:Kelch motif.